MSSVKLVEAEGEIDDLTELRLDGKVAIITGGAGGIGKATARLMGKRGARLVLVDFDSDELERARHALSHSGTVVRCVAGDITQTDVCEAAVDVGLDLADQIHILVNSAGIGGGNAEVADMSEESWRKVMDVNALGTFLACRAVLPTMLNAGYGRIVNVASIAGLEGNPRAAHYSASKAAVIALTKALAKEVATRGVLVNAVAPAVIETELLSQVTQEQLDFMLAKIPMGRAGKPEEVARLIAFLASPHLSFSTGAVYDLSGGRATY